MNFTPESNDEISGTLQQQARRLKRQAGLMSEAASDLEGEAEKVLGLLARYRTPGVDLDALCADAIAYQEHLNRTAHARWNKFVSDMNSAEKES